MDDKFQLKRYQGLNLKLEVNKVQISNKRLLKGHLSIKFQTLELCMCYIKRAHLTLMLQLQRFRC